LGNSEEWEEARETERLMLYMKRIPFRLIVLAAGCVAFAATASFAGSNRRLDRARRAYERAVVLQKELESKPRRSRKKADYEKVIREFHDVYWNDYAYPKAPVAAEAIGDLYAEMGRVFSNPAYFRDAAMAYQYVIAQYPGSSMARESKLSLGKLHLSDEAREARRNLREIARSRAEQKTEEASPPAEDTAGDSASKGTVEVTDIHDWVGPNYTRVVIGARGPIKFDALRLTHPDRIVFDLPNTRVKRSLLRKGLPIDGRFLRDIRVGQFQPTVTRVVLDVENVQDYSVFPLPNPFRLIIDVHGLPPHKAQAAPQRTTASLTARTPASSHREASASRPAHSPAVKAAPGSKTETTDTARRKPAKLAASVATPPAPAQPEELPISTKPASPTKNGEQTLTRALGLKIARIVIDPGHGGHDTGTIGPTGLEEKNVVLDIALRLRKLLETRTDCQVVMTRSTDKFIPLEERTAIANEKDADLFISIHANSSSDSQVRGIETYYLNFTTDPEALELAARENATSQESVHQLQSLIKKIALSDKVEESQELARDVQKDLYRDMSRDSHGIHNRGVRKAPFVVLIGANMPSILAEISFLSNPHSEHLLRQGSYREKIANALFQGIVKYMNNLGTIRLAQRTR